MSTAEAKVERYAGVAQVAIEVIGVLQAHLSYLSEKDKARLAQDLKARGLNVEQVMSYLSIVARKEG